MTFGKTDQHALLQIEYYAFRHLVVRRDTRLLTKNLEGRHEVNLCVQRNCGLDFARDCLPTFQSEEAEQKAEST